MGWWAWAGLTLAFGAQLAIARHVRYVPHYDLLDPLTGRSLRNPKTNSAFSLVPSAANANGGRRQREIAPNPFILPMAKHRQIETNRDSRQLTFSEEEKDPEGRSYYKPPIISRPAFFSNFFGFESSPKPYADREEKEEEESLSYATRNALFNSRPVKDSTNEVPTSAGFLSSDPSVVSNSANSFNGVRLAYKWRKRYPYYGGRRRERSAQRQSAWVLLDPLTGRPKAPSLQRPEFAARDIKDDVEGFRIEEEGDQFLQETKRFARFQPDFGNNSGAPTYKYYKKYPYRG